MYHWTSQTPSINRYVTSEVIWSKITPCIACITRMRRRGSPILRSWKPIILKKPLTSSFVSSRILSATVRKLSIVSWLTIPRLSSTFEWPRLRILVGGGMSVVRDSAREFGAFGPHGKVETDGSEDKSVGGKIGRGSTGEWGLGEWSLGEWDLPESRGGWSVGDLLSLSSWRFWFPTNPSWISSSILIGEWALPACRLELNFPQILGFGDSPLSACGLDVTSPEISGVENTSLYISGTAVTESYSVVNESDMRGFATIVAKLRSSSEFPLSNDMLGFSASFSPLLLSLLAHCYFVFPTKCWGLYQPKLLPETEVSNMAAKMGDKCPHYHDFVAQNLSPYATVSQSTFAGCCILYPLNPLGKKVFHFSCDNRVKSGWCTRKNLNL